MSPEELEVVLTPAVDRGIREQRFGDESNKREVLGRLLRVPGTQLDVLGFGGDSCEGVEMKAAGSSSPPRSWRPGAAWNCSTTRATR